MFKLTLGLDGVSRIMASSTHVAGTVDPNRLLFALFIASTKTSTIPGVSIAGPTPEATMYTPTLDAELLVYGKPLSFDVVPVSPEGVPTPAVVSRALLRLLGVPALVVNAGAYLEPRVPHVALPSKVVGERIDTGRALPDGVAARLYGEARLLGKSLGSRLDFVVGESMPGGTTTGMAIMEALGFKARGRVSSASPLNPHELKARLFESGIRESRLKIPVENPYEAIEAVGDPLHISIAGFVEGAVEAGAQVILGGGTQMCAVLAILRRLGVDLNGRVVLATTRWLYSDKSSDIVGLLGEVYPGISLLVSGGSFETSRFKGLALYEEGYVKEGVGMGGLLALVESQGYEWNRVVEAVESEYEAVRGGVEDSSS